MERNRVYVVLIMVFITAVIFTLNSCATNKVNIKKEKEIKKSVVYNNVSVDVVFKPESKLKKEFGKIDNPFISPLSFLKSNKLMVFELKIANRGNYRLMMKLNKLELQFGSVNSKPYNRFQLYNFWEPRIKKQTEYKKWNRSRVRYIINQNVFKDEVLIEPMSMVKGYIVFKGAFPEYGKAFVYIPLFDKYGKLAKRYEFEFDF